MPGLHNALNATAALAVAHQLGMSAEAIRAGLGNFGGVKPRFTKQVNGTAPPFSMITPIILSRSPRCCARPSLHQGAVIAVVQPHRYTRLSTLFNEFATCFNDADSVIVADVYPAGEKADRHGADRDSLVAGDQSGTGTARSSALAKRGRARRIYPRARATPAITSCFC